MDKSWSKLQVFFLSNLARARLISDGWFSRRQLAIFLHRPEEKLNAHDRYVLEDLAQLGVIAVREKPIGSVKTQTEYQITDESIRSLIAAGVITDAMVVAAFEVQNGQ